MGKSTVAQMFSNQGIPVFDADKAVHTMYQPGGAAVQPVGAVFPDAIDEHGGVDRAALSAQVVGNPAALKVLEGVVHPLVRAARDAMVEATTSDLVVFDVPLLFESGLHAEVDAVAVVSAPADTQRERVLARPGMTAEKFESLLARQLTDREMQTRATYIINTGCSLEETHAQVMDVLSDIRARTSACS